MNDAACKNGALVSQQTWVKESRFGNWFQATGMWTGYVLNEATSDLADLLAKHPRLTPQKPVVLDAGCGEGAGFTFIETLLDPARIVAIDIDPQMIPRAQSEAGKVKVPVEVRQGSVQQLTIASETIDVVFCHQTVHHLNDQPAALREFYRVLKPGGLLLMAESCRTFIHSLPVRLLFRHPEGVQKTADEYLDLVTRIGFTFSNDQVARPYPFWSLPDFGFREWAGLKPSHKEATQVRLIAQLG
ncbi:MAG: class I SAM-dependent methyltransferase [Proteobacteria bacterium]|nr:class I SAM-dependent methyltransferase [Pseudomonadota bacterium]